MPALNIDKRLELILYFPSMPSAMVEVPTLAERLIAGGWFMVVDIAKATYS